MIAWFAFLRSQEHANLDTLNHSYHSYDRVENQTLEVLIYVNNNFARKLHLLTCEILVWIPE